jgi:type IV pilus assembly protein PilB
MEEKEKLGTLLVKKGLLTPFQLSEALRIQEKGDPKSGIKPGEKLGKIIIKKGYVPPMELVRILCEQNRNTDYFLVGKYFLIEPRLTRLIPRELALRFEILPLVSIGNDLILVATNRQLSKYIIENIEYQIKKSIEPIVIEEKDFISNIKLCYDRFEKLEMGDEKFGELLVKEGLLIKGDVEWAIKKSREEQKKLIRVLVEYLNINEKILYEFLSKELKLKLISGEEVIKNLDKNIAKTFSKPFLTYNLLVPYKRGNNTIFIAVADYNVEIEGIKKNFDIPSIDVRLISLTDINRVFKYLFPEESPEVPAVVESMEFEDIGIEEEGYPLHVTDIESLKHRYQKAVNNILFEAIKKKASDIHLENYEDEVVMRLRIDGTLYDEKGINIGKKDIPGIINVFKVISNLDIAERRLPQGGRFRKKTKGGNIYDFRIQTQPTFFGENIVIRILSQSGSLLSLEELGFSEELEKRYLRIIRNPNGLILFVGPTGSGKTTTLYSTLEILKKDKKKKIITIEDPIEYSLNRIQQSQVKEEIGYTFASATRGFLREDPDIILIGEIRDSETAMEAIRASQTGHLVFSTIHSNDTIATVQRLMDMGIHPNSIASELLLLISQRLAKKICPHCKIEYTPDKEILKEFYGNNLPKGIKFLKGKGCDNCDNLGHKGRIAIFEFWEIDNDIKLLISKASDPVTLYNKAKEKGFTTLLDDGLKKVEAGIIDIEELLNIIPLSMISH